MLRRLLPTLLLISVAPLAGGCELPLGAALMTYPATLRYDPKPVLLLDAETGLPIRGGRVAVDYESGAWVKPYGSKATTNKKGRATLRVAAGNGAALVAGATGYNNSGPVPFAADDQVTPISIFREPHAQAGITIPAGYRGPLRVIESAPSEVEWHVVVPGVRHYFTPADPEGVTALRPPPYHKRVFDGRNPFDADGLSVARFDDGPPVPVVNRITAGAEPTLHMPTDQLAVWRIGSEMGPRVAHTVFFVGTHADAMAEMRRLEADAKGMRSQTAFESAPPPAPQKTLRQTHADLGIVPRSIP